MNTQQYEEEVRRTTPSTTSDAQGWSLVGLGLAGEAGEVVELIKKHVHHGRGLDRENLLKELGDVLWYLTLGAHLGGFTLEEVMDANIAKLRARFPHGWSAEAANAKADEKR
jgi:NTP pyrophosphatase (non-canonical NTP hydrolase)